MKSNLINSLNTGLLTATFLVSFVATARGDLEDQITKSFHVQPGGQLVVELDRGSIEIKTADANAVEVEITRKAGGSQSKAEQTLKDHEVTFAQTGDQVEVKGKYKGKATKGWFGRSPKLQVKCRITVPRKFDVNLHTAGGSIQVVELTGKVQAHTSGGSLTFKQIKGPVTARTSGGSLNLHDIDGDVNAQTSGGSIHTEKLTGQSVVKTSGGSIHVAGIKGTIDARTSGGSITAKLPDQPTGDCTFNTSGGSITIVLGDKAAVNVDLHTSAGRVSTDFPVTAVVRGEQKKNDLRGKINGGGPLITAHTSGGNVRLEKD